MFLLVGIIATTAIILTVLYYFVFRKTHKAISFIILIGISLALIITKFMHLILSAIFIFGIGLFLIKFAESQKVKKAQDAHQPI